MVRPCKTRNIGEKPNFTCFKPTGTPRNKIEKIELMLDELESIRLADLEGNSHIKAAKIMGISASTFNRILSSARKKIAEALVIGKGLRIYREDLKYNC